MTLFLKNRYNSMTISLPESIADITLEQSVQLDKLNAKRDTLDDMSFIKRFLVIFTGMKYRDIGSINVDDFNMMFAQVTKALETESPFQDRFTLDGIEYGFVPNLDEITIGEYIDLSNYGNSLETINKVMAVLFRPVISTDSFGNYEIASYDGTKSRAELMKQAPMNIVSGMLVFFCSLSKELRNHILKSMEEVEEQKSKA